MRFEDLANAVLSAQTEPNQHKQILSELFLKNKDSAHDIITICCANPRTSIKPHHVVKMLAESYGLFPEEYESLMDEHEMPSLLASDRLVFVLRGAEKRSVLDQAIAGNNDLPIARLLAAARQPVTCFT